MADEQPDLTDEQLAAAAAVVLPNISAALELSQSNR